MSVVSGEDLTIVLSCLPGERECIEDVSRAGRMKAALREVIKTTLRYIYIVGTLAENYNIKGNTLGFLLAAPVEDGKFIYPITTKDMEALNGFVERFKHENPYSTDLLRKAIYAGCVKNERETLKVETAKPLHDKSHIVSFFRKYPEEIRHGVKGEFTPVYYTSTNIINIFNAITHHNRTHADRQDDLILAVGPMSKAIYDLMQVPMGFPREGYAPVLDLEAKLLLLVPLSVINRQYSVLMSEPLLTFQDLKK